MIEDHAEKLVISAANRGNRLSSKDAEDAIVALEIFKTDTGIRKLDENSIASLSPDNQERLRQVLRVSRRIAGVSTQAYVRKLQEQLSQIALLALENRRRKDDCSSHVKNDATLSEAAWIRDNGP